MTIKPPNSWRCVRAAGGWDIVTISPIRLASGVGVAPIGLVGMRNGGGAIKSFTFAPVGTPAEGDSRPDNDSWGDAEAEASSEGEGGLGRAAGTKKLFEAPPGSLRWFTEASASSLVGKAAALAEAVAAMLIQVRALRMHWREVDGASWLLPKHRMHRRRTCYLK
jgi:hypothetical protein